MWYAAISEDGFQSAIQSTDERSTGKWLVPIAFADPDGLWDRLVRAATVGDLDAVKISSPRLDAILGHHLVCVYCSASNEDDVLETLTKLRELGVDCDLQYKSDKATAEARDEYLYSSSEFEPIPQPPGK